MKLNFLKGSIATVVVVLLVGYGISRSVNDSNTRLNDLTIQNMEALANSETDSQKCNNKNGYRIWNHNGTVLKHFRDCCYVEQNGYNPLLCD